MDTYEASTAAGEVGQEGSARATDAQPLRESSTALLYGRIQSGKTAAMIMATALAMDNGFRIVIVLTANNVTLVRQTANRFRALGGPTVLSAYKGPDDYEWVDRLDELRADIPDDGLVVVSGKDPTHLPEVIRLLQQLDAAGYPSLIFDDEADAATPDTTLAARSSGRANAPAMASTIHRRVVQNTAPGQAGQSIREALPHNLYVQVTATPYVLLLQRPDSPIRPSFVHLLEPGEGYCGGDEFFGRFDPAAAEPEAPVVLVADTEAQTLLAARRAAAPAGIAESIAFFLLAGAAHALLVHARRFPENGYKHLSHTSVRMHHHDQLVTLVQRHLHDLRGMLREPQRDTTRATFADAYAELMRTSEAIAAAWNRMPSLDDLLQVVADNFRQSEVIKVNAYSGQAEYGPAYNFVVGGNILGRGVTIDDLLVTYYLREAQTSQMDTVWQHGRMFGYRRELMPFSRVYLPHRLADRFQDIHEAEMTLRQGADEMSRGRPIPISVVQGARVTRPNALEPEAVRLYRPGTQIFPRYVVSDRALVGDSNREILEILTRANVPLDEAQRQLRFRTVPIPTLVRLAQLVPIRDDDDGRWDPDAVSAVLESLSGDYGGEGAIYVRSFERGQQDRLQTGVLSGQEVDLARAQRRPVLALVFNGEATAPEYWYPTLYMPANARSQVFNAD
ncbi:MAG: Z1 domain-containing protein [Burkholderiales bacterium]